MFIIIMKNQTILILPVIIIFGLLAFSLSLKQGKQPATVVDSSHFKQNVKRTDDKTAYQTAMERELLKEINIARANPKRYAVYAQETRNCMDKNLIIRTGRPPIMTKEGVAAVEEAIVFLKSVRHVGQLNSSQGLSLAARDHVIDQQERSAIGHTGSDGSQANQRANRYGKWSGIIGENISYGAQTPRDVVLDLIVDDGVPNRGHRRNLFNPAFHVVGVACGNHALYRSMCVMNFAGEYEEKYYYKPQ